MELHTSIGSLHALVDPHPQEGRRIYLEVDPELVRLARSLFPKSMTNKPQRYSPHITVLRHEEVPNLSIWSSLDGQKIEFKYSMEIQWDSVYRWLDCWSEPILEIRRALGLSPQSQWTRPPSGKDCFHVTIGNSKK